MAMQKGREVLIKKLIGSVFVTICGGETKEFSIDNELIDVTVPSCTAPEGKLAKMIVYGVQSLEFSITGRADNDAAGKDLFKDAVNQASDTYRVIIPGFASAIEGTALISNYKSDGPMKGNMGFSADFMFSDIVGVVFE